MTAKNIFAYIIMLYTKYAFTIQVYPTRKTPWGYYHELPYNLQVKFLIDTIFNSLQEGRIEGLLFKIVYEHCKDPKRRLHAHGILGFYSAMDRFRFQEAVTSKLQIGNKTDLKPEYNCNLRLLYLEVGWEKYLSSPTKETFDYRQWLIDHVDPDEDLVPPPEEPIDYDVPLFY